MDEPEFELFRAVLRGADRHLKREHGWLLAHEGEIVALLGQTFEPVGRKRQAAQKVYNHLMAWGAELAWFTQPDIGHITFEDVCAAAKADPDVAREQRARMFRLPFSPQRVYLAMRKHGARLKLGEEHSARS